MVHLNISKNLRSTREAFFVSPNKEDGISEEKMPYKISPFEMVLPIGQLGQIQATSNFSLYMLERTCKIHVLLTLPGDGQGLVIYCLSTIIHSFIHSPYPLVLCRIVGN